MSKVALVTGSGSGFGRGIALQLSREGYSVGLNDLPSQRHVLEALADELEGPSTIVLGDVTKEEDVEAMVEKTVKDLGGLDVMVANAGVCMARSFIDTTSDDWNRLTNINVYGVFYCIKHASKQMIKQKRGGKILTAASAAGKRGESRLSTYCSTKFAVRGLTQSAATELAPHGITVNAYAPGICDTPLFHGIFPFRIITWLYRKQEEFFLPLGRLGTTEDVVNVVSFLVSPASNHITGQSISIDGGRFMG